MLNACSEQLNGDVTTNPWVDIVFTSHSEPSSRPPTRSVHRNGNGSAPESSSPFPSVKSGLRSRRAGSHRRVVTVDGSAPCHPLQSPSRKSPPRMTDGAITRPALKRRLGSEYDFCDDSKQGSSESDLRVDAQQSEGEAEIMVVVHEVARTDSIARVALKYGISLSDLRRANHLWSSDSIHLRKVLYIPLHMSRRKDLYFPTPESGEEETVDGETQAESSTTALKRSQQRSSVVIQRIPVSQLAFFPPSSHSQQSLSPDSERKRNVFPGSSHSLLAPTVPPPMQFAGSSLGPAAILSGLLQALPLPLPRSRDTPFPRLSLDSSETSTNASETSSEQRQGHEMDVLGESRVRKRTGSGGRSDRGCKRSTDRDSKRDSAASIETLRRAGMYGADDGSTPLVPLQTEQLKPSPQMELPRLLRRDEG